MSYSPIVIANFWKEIREIHQTTKNDINDNRFMSYVEDYFRFETSSVFAKSTN